MKTTINIGDRFGHLTIINKDTRPLHRSSWLCRCDCGRELYVITSDLLRGIKSCGCSHFSDKYAPIDLTGKRFGLLTVIFRHPSTKSPHTWVCHCDCGNTVNISTSNLLSGHNKSCGCITRKIQEAYSQDLTGRRFNHLTVLSRSLNPQHKSRWLCLCDRLLKKGQTHCGPNCKYLPLQKKERMLGKRYNHLTVKRILEIEPKQYKLLCLCDCGDYTLATPYQLTSGSKRSCGCDLKKYKLSP